MALGSFNKTPTERKRYSIDYTDWLDTGEQVSAVAFAVSPSGALEVDAYTISVDGTEVVLFLNAGTDGVDYTVNVQATTDGGQVKEDEFLVKVADL